MTEMDYDHDVIVTYLDAALRHEQARNEFGHGFWLGRALTHAEQNAIDPAWLADAMNYRGLDASCWLVTG